ncbi:MAG: hypothetical protein ABIR10_13535 [Dokdonella sp.]
MIHFQRNRYSVPTEAAHSVISLRVYPTELVLVAEGRVRARLASRFQRYQSHCDRQHYIAAVRHKPCALRAGAPFAQMTAPLRSLQHHLLRRPGGDCVMPQVLASIPIHGIGPTRKHKDYDPERLVHHRIATLREPRVAHFWLKTPGQFFLKINTDHSRMAVKFLLATAGLIAIATGVAHSFLGERLIFRHLRTSSLVPSLAAPPLQSRHIRILWATWHLASVFGWALAVLLLQLALEPQGGLSARSVLGASAMAYLAGSILVLVGTRGRHPGWVALAAVGILSWVASGIV